jgi:hypothetical protein
MYAGTIGNAHRIKRNFPKEKEIFSAPNSIYVRKGG